MGLRSGRGPLSPQVSRPLPTSTLTLCLLHQCRLPRTCGWTKKEARCKGSGVTVQVGSREEGRGGQGGEAVPSPHSHPGCNFSPSLQMGECYAKPVTAMVTGEQPTGLGDHSLVGGVAVTDHLSQDPLLIPVPAFTRAATLSPGLAVVPRSRNGPAEGGGLRAELKCSVMAASSLPYPGPACLSTRHTIHRGRVMADCCSRVRRHPPAYSSEGGSESLYRPAILAAVGERKPSRHQR